MNRAGFPSYKELLSAYDGIVSENTIKNWATRPEVSGGIPYDVCLFLVETIDSINPRAKELTLELLADIRSGEERPLESMGIDIGRFDDRAVLAQAIADVGLMYRR